jgi:hypothetical protein
MDFEHLTLSDIVDFRPHELPDEELSRLESGKGMTELRRPFEEARLPGGWVGLRDKILAEAGGLLDIRLRDVMSWAWKKGRELEAYRDTERYPPDKTFSVPLVEHKITSTHTPHVDIRMNDKKVGSIHFAVNIEIAVKAMTLEIQNARIKKIHAGDCTAKGRFLCEGVLLAERESKPLDLAGTFDLGEGLEL